MSFVELPSSNFSKDSHHMHPTKPPSSKDNGLNRRSFLKLGVAGGAAAVTLPRSVMGDPLPRVSSQPSPAPFELDEITIAELSAGMQSGKFTAVSIAEKYIARIEEVDRKGPALNSIIELNPDALEIARSLDAERKERGPRGPMHGIPVLVKDNIDTADRMATTAGSLALLGSKPPSDSFLVQQLRRAGAVILGKTNLSEWANIRSSHSTSGWSGRGGLTRNPYSLDRNCSGSSSGSGAAVSANLCAAALGTETDGSIVSPSSVNGIVGIKPTVGLVSRTGVVPISHSQDTPGPMARTVRDAAILLGALAGSDKEDKATLDSPAAIPPDYTKYLEARGLRGARFGVVRFYFGYHEGVDAVMQRALDTLKAEGAELVDPVEIEGFGKLGNAEDLVLQYELKADMNAYLARLGPNAPVHTLKDIIEFNEKNRKSEMPYFGQDLFIKAEGRGPLTSAEYLEALEKCRKLFRTDGIDAALAKNKLDALVAPTDSPAWLTDLVDGDHFLGGSSTGAAVAGYPSVTLPAGYVFGLPVGVSFFGTAWSEPTLLKLAYAFEQATKYRKPPQFLPSVDLHG
ncbi:MAG TPA: amidase [Bacteroidota bacterium]|nr:amidase [Bacteroidota bacterium]